MGPHLTYSYVHGGRWKVGGSGLEMPRMLGPQAIARPFARVGCGGGGGIEVTLLLIFCRI